MAIPIVIFTPDLRFGNIIQHSMEEGTRFSFHIMEKVEEAENRLPKLDYPLAFLDASAGDNNVLQAGRLLRRMNPQMRFIIASGTGWHAALEELRPVAYITKPFYLPELTGIMDRLFPATEEKTTPLPGTQAAQDANKETPWLSDVTRAAQHLTRLTLESSAQAALITHKDELWAYAGQLPQSAARELAETVARYRDRRGESDLLRFIRLASTNADHMLYATRLATDMVLALIFDAETPFSTIRSQAGNLVRSLSTKPTSESNEANGSPDATEELDTAPTLSFAEIITDVPPPNPPRDQMPFVDRTTSSSTTPSSKPLNISRETSPAVRITSTALEYEMEEEEPLVETRAARPKKLPKKEAEVEEEKSVDTRPHSVPEGTRKIVLEPVSPAVYNLTYACLLVPRFTTHLLVGDLADRLAEWVPQICVAFGWRLEHISVHPDYLQWIINVPPVTSPGYLMRILRQHTSEKIFGEFPRFVRENPSGDFWAPGYLIMGGTQSPPSQLIREFIQQTRQRQGILQ